MPPTEAAMVDAPAAGLVAAVREARESGGGRILRAVIPLPPSNPLDWLYEQPWADRLFWNDRDGDIALAGAGFADLIETDSIEDLEAALGPRLGDSAAHVRYFGSIRFRPDVAADIEWAPFGSIRFVLPRFELSVSNGIASLSINFRWDESDEALLFEISRLMPARPRLGPQIPRVLGREDFPIASVWKRSVDGIVDGLRTDGLQKAVLARRASLTFESGLDPFTLLDRLRGTAVNCYHVLLDTVGASGEKVSFVCASPERLFRVENGVVESEALAGTRGRSSDPEEDRRLRDELVGSEKDLREHAHVLSAVRSALEPLTDDLVADRLPSTFNLANGRHLRSLVSGSLSERVSPFDLLRSLHPTPAVAGTPIADALQTIERWEPFDRGLYAGPVGWIEQHAAEFAVGIRSGLVTGNNLHLYSGAGIVAGSESEVEWDEIEGKLDDFSIALGLKG